MDRVTVASSRETRAFSHIAESRDFSDSHSSSSLLAALSLVLISLTVFSALLMSAFQFLILTEWSSLSRPCILSLSSCWLLRSSLRAPSTVKNRRSASWTLISILSIPELPAPEPSNLGRPFFEEEPPVMAPELSMTAPSRVTIRTPPMFSLATSMESTTSVFLPA